MTDIISRSPMHNDEFINKVADAMWLLMEQRVHKAVEEAIAAQSVPLDDDAIDTRIRSYMDNVSVDDFGFDIDDYSYSIESIIDSHLSGKEIDVTITLD